MLRKPGSPFEAKRNHWLGFGTDRLGQSCPQRCPQEDDASLLPVTDPLGAPLSIREVAGLIGCSPWTVRQRYLPAGLPHVRLGPTGKLIFYRNQVIRWLLRQQERGGQIA